MSTFLSKSLNEALGKGDGEKPEVKTEPNAEPAATTATAEAPPESATTTVKGEPSEDPNESETAFSSIAMLKKFNIFSSTASAGLGALKEEGKTPTASEDGALAAASTKEMAAAANEAFSSVSWKESLKGTHEEVECHPSIIFQSTTSGNSDDPTSKPSTDFEKLMENQLAPFGKKPGTTTTANEEATPAVATSSVTAETTGAVVAAAAAAAAAAVEVAPSLIDTPNPSSPLAGKKRTAPSSSPAGGPMLFIKNTYTDNDVLMGKGGRSNHHPGNQRYLRKKLEIQPRYRAATKEQKTSISQELVDSVHSWGGRFLKMDEKTKQWYMVDNKTARKKASQTLREDNTPQSRAAKRARYDKKKGKKEPVTPGSIVEEAATIPEGSAAEQAEAISDVVMSSVGRAEALAAAVATESDGKRAEV